MPWTSTNVHEALVLPIFFGDLGSSIRAVMTFPDDLVAAKAYAAHLLARRPLQDYLRAGYTFNATEQIEHLDALNCAAAPKDIDERQRQGAEVGRIVKFLWALICSHPERASWEAAVKIAIDDASLRGDRGTRATFRDNLNRFASVLHLWGAWEIRGSSFLADPARGYDGVADAGAFMTEAMFLRHRLVLWDGTRSPSASSAYLSRGFIAPWAGWQPHVPRAEWPATGVLFGLTLPAAHVPQMGKTGRPAKRDVRKPLS